jgi:uncharacterized damage-inducible protein DinB
MAIIDGLLLELEQETEVTRRVLERVPNDKLDWRPHPKARPLGQLALHIATVPGGVAELVMSGTKVQAPDFADPSPQSAAELVPALEESISKAKKVLTGISDEDLMKTWSLMVGDKEVFAIPRVGMLRSIMLNHWYHHRGQLSVYLRELDVPIPSIYGPSADENPFQ